MDPESRGKDRASAPLGPSGCSLKEHTSLNRLGAQKAMPGAGTRRVTGWEAFA